MQLIIKEKERVRINRLLKWLIYMISYTVIFVLISFMFKSIYIDLSHFYIYPFLAELIIYFLNQTIKPILVKLTIPITGMTFGLFYPFINLFILKLTDWILKGHFQLKSFWIALLFAILISIIDFLVDELIIKQIIKKVK